MVRSLSIVDLEEESTISHAPIETSGFATQAMMNGDEAHSDDGAVQILNNQRGKRTRQEADDYSLGVAKAARTEGDHPEVGQGPADVWDEDLHKQFVSAIFQIGLRNSSPGIISESMTQKPKCITSERLKSKLQKYRKNKDKSRLEFMEQYEAFLVRLKTIDGIAGTKAGSSPMALLEMMGTGKLFGGDAAAFLSYVVTKENKAAAASEIAEGGDDGVLSTQLLHKGALEYAENFAGSGISFPVLSEEEKKSSLGVSMTFVMGLFLSMTQHLMKEREVSEQRVNEEEQEEHADSVTTTERVPKISFSLENAAQVALQGINGQGGDFAHIFEGNPKSAGV